jgi:hypothetical protein
MYKDYNENGDFGLAMVVAFYFILAAYSIGWYFKNSRSTRSLLIALFALGSVMMNALVIALLYITKSMWTPQHNYPYEVVIIAAMAISMQYVAFVAITDFVRGYRLRVGS